MFFLLRPTFLGLTLVGLVVAAGVTASHELKNASMQQRVVRARAAERSAPRLVTKRRMSATTTSLRHRHGPGSARGFPRSRLRGETSKVETPPAPLRR